MSLTILTDSQFNLTPGGADDGVYTAGTPINNVLLNQLGLNIMNEKVDVRAGKEPTQFARRVGADFRLDAETTLLAAAVRPDVTFTFYPGGSDDRAYNAGSALASTKVNSLNLVETHVLVNAKPRQSNWAFYRIDNKGGSLDVDFVLHATDAANQLEGYALSNELVGFLISLVIGASSRTITIAGHGLVESLELTHGEPNRGRLVLDCGYGQNSGPAGSPGSPFTFTDSDANSPLKAVQDNDVLRLASNQIVAGAVDVDVTGVLEEQRFSFNRDCRFSFTLRPYGSAPVVSYL